MSLIFKELTTEEQRIYHALQSVIDPEIGENLIDLGLIYGIRIEDNIARITFTMTSYACPMSELVIEDIHETLRKTLADNIEIDLDLIWEPAWEPSMIVAEARKRLGWD